MGIDTSAVFIIIPVHNRKATTLRCLRHLRDSGDLSWCRAIVVDDGSTDGTAEAVQARFPEATVLRGDGNLWWTGAIVLGMRHAVERGADFLVWLNDDVLPDAGALEALIGFLRAHPRAIAGASFRHAATGRVLATGFRGRRRLAAGAGEAVPVDGMSGYCVGLPAAVVASIGYPDASRFPHYAADGMYLLKAGRAGFRVFLLGQAVATIEGGGHDTTQGFADYCRYLGRPAFRQVFLRCKSPYHLRTQINYHIEKYGFVVGWSLSAFKFLIRLLQWALIRLCGSADIKERLVQP